MQPSLESVLALVDGLSACYAELQFGVRKAVQIAEADPEMALTRTRKVLEYVVRDVFEKRCEEPPGTRPLENLLQTLVRGKHLPAHLEAYAGAIRVLGNVGAHRFGETVRVSDVYLALVQLLPMLEWYFEMEGILPQLTSAPPPGGSAACVYDNRAVDPTFQTWGLYSPGKLFRETIRLIPQEIARAPEATASTGAHLRPVPPALLLHAVGTEKVGVNKAVPHLAGEAVFEYQALASSSPNMNLLFCVIPMQRDLPSGEDLVEVGAEQCDEPENAFSPYRRRFFVPREHVQDGRRHQARIDFDFATVATAAYTILAPRVNEGCSRPAAGQLLVGNVQVYAAVEKVRP